MLRRSHTVNETISETSRNPEYRLTGGGTWSHRPGDNRHSIRVVDGEAYVTEEGAPEDWFLHSGDTLPLAPHRLVVVQGHPEAVFAVDDQIA